MLVLKHGFVLVGGSEEGLAAVVVVKVVDLPGLGLVEQLAVLLLWETLIWTYDCYCS